MGNLDYSQLHDAELNDIWGYVDETGKEYALVGTTKGVSVVDVSNPTNPVEVFWQPGMESIWRDLSTWGDFAYITTEAPNGILIIDLSPLPNSTILPTAFYYGDNAPWLTQAHTLFIDEVGRCFVFGSNLLTGGVQIFDVATNPMSPTKIGEFENWYVHDGVVRNDTMFLANSYDGFFSIVDISDVNNPSVLGIKSTPSGVTHNIWFSDDGQFVYTTDEVSGGFITAYDITIPSNIIELDRVQSSHGAGVVPHNTHVYGNHIVTSYYSDGIIVHDATLPYNLIEVAKYDTYPGQTTGFEGCWGAYPFLPSGNLLATDRTNGLFILGVNYQQAAYLEGTITDITNSNPINSVSVTISGLNAPNTSNNQGFYATGNALGGMVQVIYEKLGYLTEVQNVQLIQGAITVNHVQLVPLSPIPINIIVLDALTNEPIPDVFLRLEGQLLTHEGNSNGIGQESLILYYAENYTLTAGVWGYKTKCENFYIDNSMGEITIELQKGYYDDFSFDFGWQISGTAITGKWTRAIPFGTQENANPPFDANFDCGNYAFVTGNLNDTDFTLDDVDSGQTRFFSPIMDLSTYNDPHLNFSRWFYADHGPFPVANDSLKVFVLNGFSTKLIDICGASAFNNQWNHQSIRISDYILVTNNMQIRVQTSDYAPDSSVVEAGFDRFFISEYNTTTISQEVKNEISIFPNPFQDGFTIQNAEVSGKYEIYNLNGQQLMEGTISSSSEFVKFSSLDAGIYLLKIGNEVKRIVKN